MERYCWIILLIVSKTVSAFSPDVKQHLSEADSLFTLQEYTSAISIYDDIYQSGYISPQMALKMAYIYEGLEDYTNTLFFLKSYHALTHDAKVLEKMERLASKHNLSGYQVSDESLIMNYILGNRSTILYIIGAIALVTLVAIILLTAEKKTFNPVLYFFFLTLLLFGAVYNIQLFSNRQGIIYQPTYVMSDPSAASELVAILPAGNQVNIRRNNGIWVHIKSADTTGYIRNHQIKPIIRP